MQLSELVLHLHGVPKPVAYPIASDERDRWLERHQPEHKSSGFCEYRTVNHRHLFINSNHIVVARLLNDEIIEVPDDYDVEWKQREQPDAKTGEYSSELWRFRFWLRGCDEPFDVEDLDEHDFVTIWCGLMNYEHEGCTFVTVDDEDDEPISLRIADIMVAEGFDYKNYDDESQDSDA